MKRTKPGKNTATVTGMASGTARFEVGFVIRLNGIAFRALVTNPLFVVAMLPPKMLLYPNKIAKSMTRVMVQTAWFWAHKHPLLHLLSLPLKQFPWHFVPSSVHLKVLVSLKPLVADLTHISVRFQ